MKKSVAIRKAGSAVALSRLVGVSQSAVSQWGDTIPKARVWQLKLLRPAWFKDTPRGRKDKV